MNHWSPSNCNKETNFGFELILTKRSRLKLNPFGFIVGAKISVTLLEAMYNERIKKIRLMNPMATLLGQIGNSVTINLFFIY